MDDIFLLSSVHLFLHWSFCLAFASIDGRSVVRCAENCVHCKHPATNINANNLISHSKVHIEKLCYFAEHRSRTVSVDDAIAVFIRLYQFCLHSRTHARALHTQCSPVQYLISLWSAELQLLHSVMNVTRARARAKVSIEHWRVSCKRLWQYRAPAYMCARNVQYIAVFANNNNNNKLNGKWCNLYVSWFRVFRYFLRAFQIVYNDFMIFFLYFYIFRGIIEFIRSFWWRLVALVG